MDQQQCPDRHETQPESHAEETQGIQAQYYGHGQQIAQTDRLFQIQQGSQHEYGGHYHGPLRRQSEAADGAIPGRGGQGRNQREFLRRREQHQRRKPANQSKRQPVSKQTDQPDVQARDHEQVIGSGLLEQLPLLIGKAASVTEHQRYNDSRRGGILHQPQNFRLETASQRRKPCRASIRQHFHAATHIAPRRDSLLKQPGLVIEGAWIGQTARPVQPHFQPIGSARENFFVAVMVEQHLAPVETGIGLFNIELELLNLVEASRQAAHCPRDPHVDAFKCASNLRIKPRRGPVKMPGESQQSAAGQQGRLARKRGPVAGENNNAQRQCSEDNGAYPLRLTGSGRQHQSRDICNQGRPH